jgi:hypothetical protein
VLGGFGTGNYAGAGKRRKGRQAGRSIEVNWARPVVLVCTVYHVGGVGVAASSLSLPLLSLAVNSHVLVIGDCQVGNYVH